MIYAMQWTGTQGFYGNETAIDGGFTSLCEVEGHVVYDVGSRALMEKDAAEHNARAAGTGSTCRYRAVPLPWTGAPPDYYRTR